jgi:hypothetical protein
LREVVEKEGIDEKELMLVRRTREVVRVTKFFATWLLERWATPVPRLLITLGL